MKQVICMMLAVIGLISGAAAQTASPKKIQVAILLDVSNSMDGLIDQAKAQLWNMVTVLGKAECQGIPPKTEIALYEYGRSSNDKPAGYVKQLSPFTTDLDRLSATLFSLSTNGGDEYCGQVIKTSLEQLQWDPAPGNYKVIFIAGNEDFLQGNVPFTEACALAKQKGVIVNTIYCGEKSRGIQEHWNLGGECGNGSYTHIDQQAKEPDIDTPFDSALYVLNRQLNETYIAYGAAGEANYRRQAEMDRRNASLSKNAGLGRVAVKAARGVYDNTDWDLVDAFQKDTAIIGQVDPATLPAAYRHLSRTEISRKVKESAGQREKVREEIGRLNQQRSLFITEAKKSNAATASAATLETEIEKILKDQAKRYGIGIN